MRRIILSLAIVCLSVVPAAAQNPATAAAVSAVVELEKTLAKAKTQLAAIKAAILAVPACPAPVVCPTCPPPTICPTCPPPVICPVVEPPAPVACVVSAWGEWSAWTPLSATEESHTRTRTVVTPAANGGTGCPALTETETRAIVVTVPGVPTVADSAALTAALLKPGDYQLVAGVRYVGNFAMVTEGVRLHGAPNLPAARVQAGATAAYALTPSDLSRPVLTILASHVLVEGITLNQGQKDRGVVQVGNPFATDPLTQPDDVTLDRVEVPAGSAGGKRGIELDARGVTVSRSRVTNFWYAGDDAQAIYACNGPGPYQILDNYLEGSSEVVMFGGGSIRSAAMIPSGVVRGNWMYKPDSWKTNGAQVKNTFELKAANGVLVEDNIFDGNWLAAQTGSMVVITPRNQYNDSPWTVVQDVIIRRNIFRRHSAGFAVNILGTDNINPSQQTARIEISGNYISDSPKGIQILGGVAGWLKIVNNTMPKIAWQVLQFEGTQVLTPLTFSRNVVRAGAYGILGQLAGGIDGLNLYCAPGWVVQGNVVELPVRSIWPSVAPNSQAKMILAPDTLAPYLDAEGHYIPGGAGW